LGTGELGEATHTIIAALSMQYFGFCVLELPGGICPQIMETGRTPTAVFAVGETKAFGSGFWKC